VEAHPLKWHFEPAKVVRPSYASIRPTSAGWPAVLAASAFNRLDQYASVLVTGPTVMQNSLFRF